MNRGAHFLSSDTRKANFYIGGVGATLNTEAAVAAKFKSLSSAEIFNLEVDASNNISFLLNKNVEILANAFSSDSSITYFIDVDNRVTGGENDHFVNCANLKYIHCRNMNISYTTSGLKRIYNNDLRFFESDYSGNLGHYYFDSEDLLTHIILPNVSRIRVVITDRRTMLDLTTLKRFYAPNLTAIDTFWDLHGQEEYVWSGTMTENPVLYVNPELATAGRGRVTGRFPTGYPAVGETVTIGGLVYTCVASGAVEGEWVYSGNRNTNTSNFTAAVRADTRTGSEAFTAWNANDEEFAIVATALGPSGNGISVTTDSVGAVIDSPVTVGGGDEHETLRWMRSSKPATIVYVDNIISQDPPTDLIMYNLTANTFDIGFTAPTANANGNDGYLLWIDDGTTKWHKYFPITEVSASGETIDVTGYDPSTLTVKMQAFDTQFNRSVLSEPAVFAEPNTFIGGVGASTIQTANNFGGDTTLNASDIRGFAVDGNNNVSFRVDKAYNTIKSAFFNNDDNVTYFIDLSGRCHIPDGSSAWDNFDNCDNIEYIYLPRTQYLGFRGAQGGADNLFALKHINLQDFNPPLGYLGRNVLSDATSLKKLDLRSATALGVQITSYDAFYNLSALERLYIANVTTFAPIDRSREKYFKNIKSTCKIYINSATFGVQDRNAWNLLFINNIQATDEITINGLVYTAVNGTPSVEGEFDMSSSARANLVAAINADTRTGTVGDVSATAVAYSVGSDLEVYLESSLTGTSGNATAVSFNLLGGGTVTAYNSTFTGGNDIEYYFMYFRDDVGCTIVEVGHLNSDPLAVNRVTDLASTNLTTTTVDLTFTAPTANANGNEAYEVWVDDGTPYRKHFEHSEITASGATVDLTDVYNDVGSLSGVKIRLKTMDGEMNFSDFSNEITL